MDWLIAAVITVLGLCAFWLYGNKSWKAPVVYLVICSLWAYYYLDSDQIPLLIPTAMTTIIQTRNLIKMRRER